MTTTTLRFRSTITSNQRAFNAVCRHLAKQQTRARTRLTAEPNTKHAYACEYFTQRNGNRCAIGALLTLSSAQDAEHHYHGQAIAKIAQYISPDFSELNLSINLLTNLQQAHDESDTLTELRQNLTDIASAFHLNPAAIQAITKWEGTQ